MKWNTVEEFAFWYKQNRYPIRPPFEDPIYVTDISYSYVLFREGQFQVELYLVRPNTASPEHSHPGVDNIVMLWGGDIGATADGIVPATLGLIGQNIKNGTAHALHAGDKGCAVLSIEKWADGMKPTSVSINWKGDPCGDVHDKLIKDENII